MVIKMAQGQLRNVFGQWLYVRGMVNKAVLSEMNAISSTKTVKSTPKINAKAISEQYSDQKRV
jgi:hypothetical protein